MAGAMMLHLNRSPKAVETHGSSPLLGNLQPSGLSRHSRFRRGPGAISTADVAEPQEWNHLVLTFDSRAA